MYSKDIEVVVVEANADTSLVREMSFARAESLTMYGILEGVVPTDWKTEIKKKAYDPKKNEKKGVEAEKVKEKGKLPEKPKKWNDQ